MYFAGYQHPPVSPLKGGLWTLKVLSVNSPLERGQREVFLIYNQTDKKHIIVKQSEKHPPQKIRLLLSSDQ